MSFTEEARFCFQLTLIAEDSTWQEPEANDHIVWTSAISVDVCSVHFLLFMQSRIPTQGMLPHKRGTLSLLYLN